MAFISLDSIPDNEIFPDFTAKIIHSETKNLTLVYVTVKAGTILPAHAHPQEQITNVLAGKLEITLGDETQILQPGMIGTIPPKHGTPRPGPHRLLYSGCIPPHADVFVIKVTG